MTSACNDTCTYTTTANLFSLSSGQKMCFDKFVNSLCLRNTINSWKEKSTHTSCNEQIQSSRSLTGSCPLDHRVIVMGSNLSLKHAKGSHLGIRSKKDSVPEVNNAEILAKLEPVSVGGEFYSLWFGSSSCRYHPPALSSCLTSHPLMTIITLTVRRVPPELADRSRKGKTLRASFANFTDDNDYGGS